MLGAIRVLGSRTLDAITLLQMTKLRTMLRTRGPGYRSEGL